MAETREIVVRVIGGVDESKKIDPIKTSEKTTQEKDVTISPLTSVMLNQAWTNLKSTMNNQVNYAINRHFQLTGDYIGQRTLNNAKTIISRVGGVANSIAVGVAFGGAVGGAIALGSEAIKLTTDVFQNYDQQNINLRRMNAQLQFTRERAGYSLQSGSVGENR